MMSIAIVEALLAVEGVEIMLTRDARLPLNTVPADRLTSVTVTPETNLQALLAQLIYASDAVWPIAPETDNTLYDLCRLVESLQTTLLTSPSSTVQLTADKWLTYRCLQAAGIPVVETKRYRPEQRLEAAGCRYVAKPVDGVGCEGIKLVGADQLERLNGEQNYLLQPYVPGRSLSLSALFYQGKGWLVCVNQQWLEDDGDSLKLTACQVNIAVDNKPYQALVDQIAEAIPGLWGYIGIDLIASESGPQVLEINPRLTTAFTGIGPALGLNIGEIVINMVDAAPIFKTACNQSVRVTIGAL